MVMMVVPERESLSRVVAVEQIDLTLLFAILYHMHTELVILRPGAAAHGYFNR